MRPHLLAPHCIASIAFLVPLALSVASCAGNPAAPFDAVQNAPMTAFRLQNYEPPPMAAAPAGTPPLLPGLPPEIQQWIQAGASMLPPGLLPPGLIPGTQPPQAPVVDTTPRFHGFRILGQVQLNDEKARKEIADILGFEKNFDNSHGPCMYAEFGFSFARLNPQPPADVLVSLSCDQVQAFNFVWPHRYTGLTPDTVQRIAKVTRATFNL